jgi:hypothetical protein
LVFNKYRKKNGEVFFPLCEFFGWSNGSMEAPSGSTFWKHLLEAPSGSTFWKHLLEAPSGSTFWKHLLEAPSRRVTNQRFAKPKSEVA